MGSHIAPSVSVDSCAVDKDLGYGQAADVRLWHASDKRKPSRHPANARSASAGPGVGCLLSL